MKITTRNVTLVGLLIALAIIIPIFFHVFGLGKMFLPMFLPILIAGFFLDPFPAMIVGVLSPLLSAFITGMPPLMPTGIIMCVEGLALAGISSYLYRKKKYSLWISLIAAILVERIVLVVTIFVVTPLLNLPSKLVSVTALTVSLPGIALQLLLVPALVVLIERAVANPSTHF